METLKKAQELRRLLENSPHEYPVDLLDSLLEDIDQMEYEAKQEIEVKRPSEFEAIFGKTPRIREEDLA